MKHALVGTFVALFTAAASAACGSSSSGPSSASPPPASGNSLTGSYAFPVAYTLLGTDEAKADCGYGGMLADGYSDFGVYLADTNISGLICAGDDAGPRVNSAPGHPFVVIQMKSISYARGGNLPDGGVETAIVPGTYGVGFEGLSDDDLCMANPGAPLLDVLDFGPEDGGGAIPVASAATGTVTLTTIALGHIAGSFDVQMVALLPSGQYDTEHPTPFSGTFDATTCPGTTTQ
jgi:hypothetical protein